MLEDADLPDDTYYDDEDGAISIQFAFQRMEYVGDDKDSMPYILALYRDSTPAERRLINIVFTHLCGYSLPDLVRKAYEADRDG